MGIVGKDLRIEVIWHNLPIPQCESDVMETPIMFVVGVKRNSNLELNLQRQVHWELIQILSICNVEH